MLKALKNMIGNICVYGSEFTFNIHNDGVEFKADALISIWESKKVLEQMSIEWKNKDMTSGAREVACFLSLDIVANNYGITV